MGGDLPQIVVRGNDEVEDLSVEIGEGGRIGRNQHGGCLMEYLGISEEDTKAVESASDSPRSG